MKTVYTNDLADGDDLSNEPFLLQDVMQRETKDGRPYLLCTFRDRTGVINGIFWDVPDDVEGWVRPGVVTLVTGRVTNYRGALQINTTDLNPQMVSDMTQFLPASQRPREEMVAELRQVIAGLSEPWQRLAGRVLLERDFLNTFANAPAARVMHHAYVGGLLEHTLSMVSIAQFLARHYPYVNKDLLLAGVLLHDMGKALEYTTKESFDFTDDGRLVGHIIRGIAIVEKAAAELGNFPEEELRQLVHLIASHHGTLEWGSPVVPKTLEAVLLHQIDLLDSRIQGFFDHLRNDNSQERWSGRPSPMFNTELRRPPGFK
ncbi:MAG: 3'-5' exoribonuclease YhaM family protein [Chloroflexi bacterium]|nr:3'-5' exoribonuclease YhaM family protein [Chloroflexota bacterium]MCI0577303.1 3'-5' exoribonuclease YhaM family protein [Chloroflexota bacterium]MCI0647747.1 3'-5' exoribonuclease YhaM family protein [Chloroflexota bacterium]MCI0731611.1 3'-5' exoribonuclease YhaM family protein [Chloroflexota bacterium]